MLRYDEDVSESEWRDLRRAMRALFRVLYGATPKITHRRERGLAGEGEERWHRVRLTAPAAPTRNAVNGSIGCSSKIRCYLHLIEEMRDNLDSHRYDAFDDEWIVETSRGGDAP